MSWAKFDDQYPDHPKIVEVGPLGMALHVAATCYCARYLTDGFIPAQMMGRLINFDGINANNNAVSNKTVTDDLVRSGLLEVVPGGYMVHDYLEYNPSGEQVRAERKANKERQNRFKSNNGVNNGVNNSPPSPSPVKIKYAPSGAPAPLQPAAKLEAEVMTDLEIKNPGALEALRKFQAKQERGEPDLAQIPEHLWPLATAFIKASGIQPFKLDYKYWNKTLDEQWERGIKPEFITKAIKNMRKDGLTIKSPASVTGIANDLQAKAIDKADEYLGEVYE